MVGQATYLACAREQYDRAARLLGAVQQARVELNALLSIPQEIEEYEQAMEQLAEALGEEERKAALAEGAQMSLDDAVLSALAD